MVVKLTVTIETVQEDKIGCLISDTTVNLQLYFFPKNGSISYSAHNYLVDVIRMYQFQFDKIMRSAIKGNLTTGQTINCVFIDGFTFLNSNDYNRFIQMDRRAGKLSISTSEAGSQGFYKLFADGSFSSKTKQSAYGGFIEDQMGNREIFHKSFKDGGSNLMELLAVTEGLQLLKHVMKIQVNTDSRFVIRGLVQWVHFWRFNNWQTAYGSGVKYAKYWQHIDQLCDDKILEFKWIKGHSGHIEQDFCHKLAKQSTTVSINNLQ
jgi:ribonuclease HI